MGAEKVLLQSTPVAKPQITVSVLIVFFGVLVPLLMLGDRLLYDADTYWHIAVGERIWRTGAFPRSDELSHTFAGAPWIAKEWLSQVLLYGAHALAGWWGVAGLAALIAAGSFAALFAWLLRRLKLVPALAIITIVFVLAEGHILARPHIFSMPLLMLWVGCLVNAVERNARPPWWLVPLMALWANLHASFPIAFLLAGLLAMEAILSVPAAARIRTAANWGVFGLAALLATGLSPYGFGSALVTVNLFGSGESFRYIAEWQPIGLDLTGALAIEALLGSLLLLAGSLRQNGFRVAIILLCGYLMVAHVRFVSLYVIVAALVLAAPLARRFPGLQAQPGAAMSPGARIGALGCLAVLIGASAALPVLVQPAPNPAMTPAAALAAARELGVSGPVYNDYDFGGYLIAQGVPTFIDGRADQIFLGGFMDQLYERVRNSDASRFTEFLDRYGVTWALVRLGSPEARHLESSPDWQTAYEDELAAVFLKRLPQTGTGTP